MKRKVLIIIQVFTLLILTETAGAQKIIEDKIDDFEGFRSISTSQEVLRGKNILSKNYVAISATYYMDKRDTAISFRIVSVAPYTISSDKDSEIMFKMKSGKIIKLQNQGSYDISSEGEIYSLYSLLSADDILALTSEDVEKIRLSTNSATDDIVLDVKKQAVIKNIISLLKNYKL